MPAKQRGAPTAEKSMAAQKVATYLAMAQRNEMLWGAFIVFLGTLFLLGAVPFYPVYLIPVLALVSGLVAYFVRPAFGTLLGILLAFPAVIYQSSVFGWLFLLIIVVALFEVFENWLVISVLKILIAAPFSFGQLPFFGWITIAGMVMASLYFGSKRSILISVPSVLAILLLSSLWLVENSAFMPLNLELYRPGVSELMFSRDAVGIGEIGSALGGALGGFASFENLGKLFAAMGWAAGNIMLILFSDSGIIQLAAWVLALYVISVLSAKITKRPQLVSSLALLITVPFYYAAGIISGTGFRIEFLGVLAFSVALLGVMEHFGIRISRESELRRKEKMKAYGKFGMADIGAAGAETLDDVGNYDDVKDELKESILVPLEKKEIAYTYGIKPPSGILLFGPPGTGKTMLMRALARTMRYNFIEVKCSQILSMWYGESLPYDEKVLFERNGKVELVEMGRIVEEKLDGKVLAFDEKGKVRFSKIKKHIKHRCTSKILEVRTRTGRRIRVTDYHSLFAFNGTRIESTPTSKLVPGKSYIAIPARICRSGHEINEIDILKELGQDDHGLFVRNAQGVLRKAIAKLGEKEVLKILNFSKEYLYNTVLRRNIGIRAKILVRLMEKARISYKDEGLVFSGKRELPVIINIDENFAEFLGLWVAEGSYNRKDTVRMSVSDSEIKKVAGLCSSLFGPVTIYSKGGKGRDIYIGSRALYVLLKEVLGLSDGAYKKKMPNIAFGLSTENKKALLRGYFSGDGTVYTNGRGVPTVEASTASEHLADQLTYLLLYFNIVARIYNKIEWNGTKTKRICFTGYHYLNSFVENIGFIAPEKNNKIRKYVDSVSWWRSEQIPLIGQLKDAVEHCRLEGCRAGTIGRDVLLNAPFDDEIEFLEQLKNDVCLDRVEEVKEVDDEEWVYDVAVEPCQNFVGGFGGIFAHNSEKNVSEVFSNARKTAPTILFFDEIDAVGKKRSEAGTDEVTPRVLTALLQEMDGAVKSKANVIVIGATNVPNKLDPALLRPGRFDKIIYMHLPEAEGRRKIFEVSMGRTPVAGDVDFDLLARKTERFSGADIKNVVTEAKRLAAKEAAKTGKVIPISMEHLMRVVKAVKPSTTLSHLDDYERFRMDFERRVVVKEEVKPKKKEVSWADVAGLEEVKTAFLEAIELPLIHEDLMKKFKVKPSKGILLFGPPGTGKTLLVKAASNELNASFQSISGAELMKKGYLQAVTVIKEVFNRARENPPAIIFVDEIETFAPARGVGASEITGQFLTEMDGIKGMKSVVVIAATNKPDLLDPAILRPGRFDKIFYVPPPDQETRVEIFRIHLAEFSEGVDLERAAELTPGFTGADIAAICQEAKMMALRAKLAKKEQPITTEMLLDIIKRRRPSVTPGLLREYQAFLEKYGERK